MKDFKKDAELTETDFLQKYADCWEESADFYELLLSYFRKSGKHNSEIAARSNIHKSTVGRIIGKKTFLPSRDTVIALAFGLELTAHELQKLLKARDIHDSFPSDKRDYLILYHLACKKSTLIKLNIALYENGCAIVGEKKR